MWMSMIAGLLFATAGCAAAIEDFIAPPAEFVDRLLERRDISSDEAFEITHGLHEGHMGLRQPIPRFDGCPVRYALAYNVCLDRDAHPGMVDVWPREGGLGVGLSGPTSTNWYGGGFIDLLINGQSPGPYKPTIEVEQYERARTVAFTWDTPQAAVTLRFTATDEHDRLFLSGHVEPRQRVHSLRLVLTCYPSSFREPRERRAATALREVEAGRTAALTPGEFWLLLYDGHFDAAVRPDESQGPAAVMFSPTQVRRATVNVGEYPIRVELDLHRHLREFRLALWEFPRVANAEALARMTALTEGLAPPEIPVVTEGVPPRALAVEGQAAATLVIPADAPDQVQLAAQELQDALVDMARALLPIRSDDQDIAGNRVFLGDTRQAQEAGLTMPQTSPGEAGFRITTLGSDIFITAEDPIAVVYGACELLERLGVRWYMPGPLGTVMPERETVIVPELDVTSRPSFPMRWVGRSEWAYRNKCNGRIGGGAGNAWGFNIRPGVYHGDYHLLPVSRYFEEHPEYFALVDGERYGDRHTKLCVSNPDVAREVARNIGALLDEDPTIDLIGMSPTDYTNYCECPECVAMDDVEERPADQRYSRRMLLFYNAVARELARTHPEAKILAGAYHWYNQPPADETITAEPNLALVICHYTEYCSMHEIEREDCPRNARFRDLLGRWRGLIPDIYFYEYYYTDGFRQLPCNLVHAIRRDIPYFHREGYKGLYTQYGNIWNTLLNYYVAAKLLWDVEADVDAILEEFYAGFFGEAAAPMRAYFELLSRVLDETEEHLCTCSAIGRDMRLIFTGEVLAEMRGHHEAALALAEDELVAARLEKIGAAVEYTERFMDYLDDHYAATRGEDMEERAVAARRALDKLEALHEEVQTDRAKWDGVASPGSYHWRYDLQRARRIADRYRVIRGEEVGSLPERWRFSLDRDNVGVEEEWFRPDFDDGEWDELLVTTYWEEQGYPDYDGYAWYRTPLTLTAAQTDGPLALHFAGVDAHAWVYLDGELIGHHDQWDVPFAIEIPRELAVADREMTLAVRVYDSAGPGGMYGPVTLMHLDR